MYKMQSPYVIAINSVSGGGKTALAEHLHESLSSSVLFRFGDFDDTNIYQDDYYEWTIRGADLSDFDCPGMSKAIAEEIEKGKVRYIILDFPWGRAHHRLKDLIDLSIYVDTPLDIAMARRILRDYLGERETTASERMISLKKDLVHYLNKARIQYLGHFRHKEHSDLILDGCKSLEELRDNILDKLCKWVGK